MENYNRTIFLQRKNLLLIIPSLSFGGAERVASILASELSKKYNVYLVVLHKSKNEYLINEMVNVIYLDPLFLPSNNVFHSIFKNVNYIKKIHKIITNNDINIILSLNTTTNILSIIASIINRKKIIISERNNPNVYKLNVIWNFLRKFFYPFCDYLILQTEAIKKDYFKIISHNKIKVIPNPIKQDLLNNKFSNSTKENIILTVGRLDENKNQMMLINSFANLNDKKWKLYIVGDGKLRLEYEEYVKKINLLDNIIFTGMVNDISYYYDRAKIFVLTSNSEGFPNVLLEAMSKGIPCISTNCNYGPSELIIDSENGYLVEIDNINQLKEKLNKLMYNTILQQQFSQKGINTSKHYSIEFIVSKWDKLITSLVN
nr:glycosyltransferase [uncultured Flavobacterium sp.]